MFGLKHLIKKTLNGNWRIKIIHKFAFLNWGISSVGLERCLDRAEVTGSNPVYPTY